MVLKILLYLISITYASTALALTQADVEVIERIALRASQLNPKLDATTSLYLAYHIKKNALERNLEPLVMAAIIATESDFRLDAYNESGDYSLVQINYRIWSAEFKRMRRMPLDKDRLIHQPSYAIKRMAEILDIMRSRFPNDRYFYARYHSNTEELRTAYLGRVKERLSGF